MTSHLITDSFVSGVAFFPLLVSSLSPLIPFPFRFSKKSGKVVLPSSCGFFCACFLWPEKIVSGRGRPLRSGGGGGGGSGGGETWVHAAAAAVERAGSYTTVRGLRQIGQNLRPDGTSAGSCGKKPDKKRAEGVKAREKDERHWQTRERERESARTAWVWRRGSRSAVSRSCHWGQRAGASTTPRHLPCACPYRRAHARGRRSGGEGGEGGGCSRSPALCCIHLLSEMACLVKWMKWVKMIRQDEYFFVCGNNNVALE